MTAYFDTSAILKLAFAEPRTPNIQDFLRGLLDAGVSPSTSWLGETEFARASMRKGLDSATASATMADFDVFDVPKDVFDIAGRFPIRTLRTLDALHIAIALRARADVFVSYDLRQSEAAAALGLKVLMP